MSYSSNYIITTLSNSVAQRDFDSGISGTQAPMAFGVASGPPTLRQRSTPYLSTVYSEPPDLVPISDAPTFPAQNLNAGYISSIASVYTGSLEYIPTLYTQIISASNPNGTTPMQIGSLWLDAKTYLTIGALITGSGGANSNVEFKRFTGGSSLLQMSNSGTAGGTWAAMSSSNVVVSNSDWYDIYISGSNNPMTSSIRGVFYEL
tara:strand:+ start:794 stop:1408 length:615 start_codon:yes stop_codon:yes gene_type:complete